MFDILNEMIKKKKKEKVRIHFSSDMIRFMTENKIPAIDMLFDFDKDCEICYVDFSDKPGYVKIMPTSKYIYILNKYKELEKMDDDWYKNIRNHFPKFYKYNNRVDIIDKNIQYMRSGKFVKRILDINPYDVETFVIRYKHYQKLIK